MIEEIREKYINPYTDRLFEQAEIAKYSPEERREYAESIKNYWDYYSTMKTAEDKGREEGRAEGRAEGREEGRTAEKKENARRMKAKGYPAEDIADITGLSAEDIEGL
jgi:predicted transposase/invertase (TIGR01784 family)